MSVHTFSSRDFTRDVSAAKRATADGPVFITDRGRQAYVLLKIEDYHQLGGSQEISFLDLMQSISGGKGIDFDPPKIEGEIGPTDLGVRKGNR